MKHAEILLCMEVELKATTKAVFNVIAVRANPETAIAHLSHKDLEKATCMSDSSVKRAVRELNAMGLVTRFSGGGRGKQSAFKLHMGQVYRFRDTSDDEQTPLEQAIKGVTQTPLSKKGGHTDLKGGHTDPKGGHTDPPKEYKNIKNIARARVEGKNGSPVNGADRAGRGVSKATHRQESKKQGGPAVSPDLTPETLHAWCHCLQGDTSNFGLPDSAVLGSIENGTATIYGIEPFYQEFLRKDTPSKIDRLSKSLSMVLGEKINVETPREGRT